MKEQRGCTASGKRAKEQTMKIVFDGLELIGAVFVIIYVVAVIKGGRR